MVRVAWYGLGKEEGGGDGLQTLDRKSEHSPSPALPRFAAALRQSVRAMDPWLVAALLLGIVLRAWAFGAIPPGFNQDEASTAYDAFSLAHYGTDRHGYPFPVMLVSWGSGMYALASYLEAPFIRLLGTTVVAARLPFLLVGLAAIPLFYLLLDWTTDRRTARIGALLLAICPWHIMVSRWALDSNLLPFVFLVGAVLLVRAQTNHRLLPVAAAAFALALYAYGTAYVAIPVFLVLAFAYALHRRLWKTSTILLSMGAFAAVALPVALYVAINSFGGHSIRTPFLSIPKLTGVPRFSTVGNIQFLSAEFFRKSYDNLSTAAKLFQEQDDGNIYSVAPPHGLFYWFSPLLALVGLASLIGRNLRVSVTWMAPRSARRYDPSFFLLAWCVSSVVLCAFVHANVNRVNFAMFPFLFCTAIGVRELSIQRSAAVLLAGLWGVCLLGFVSTYFGPYRKRAAHQFFSSFGEALQYAAAQTDEPICVTHDDVNMPYIFALFYNRESPDEFRNTVKYENPGAEFQFASSFGRYRFTFPACVEGAGAVVVTREEAERLQADGYARKRFELYTVLTRRPLSSVPKGEESMKR